MIHQKLRNTCLILIFLWVGVSQLHATHIIGGEMNYRCLGDNNYEIALTIYRDCHFGVALMDDTAYVAIYDVFGQLNHTLPILLGRVDTVRYQEDCFITPGNICVETTTYRDTIQLQPKLGGYHIAYQRCCRNETILNIVDPLNMGATYDIILSYESMLSCNSSPVIKEWPPTFVCKDRLLLFDHSAEDTDGDSLAYRLFTPLTGGIPYINPRPRPAYPPPYDTIRWLQPTYSKNNMLGGNNPLTIDARTGLLSGIPPITGQFVVGVAIDEYRNGRLTSTTHREFQYNVVPCEDLTAQFEIQEVLCEGIPVIPSYRTQQDSTNNVWKLFDKNGQLIATSTENSPVFAAQQPGKYSLRLIVNPDVICRDSIEKEFQIIDYSLTPAIDYQIIGCVDSLQIQLEDNSAALNDSIVERLWTVSGKYDQFTSRAVSPIFTIQQSQTLLLELALTTASGCQATVQEKIATKVIPDSLSLPEYDTLVLCHNDSVILNQNYIPNLKYQWIPSTGLSNPNLPNPAASPDSSVVYTLIIQDSAENCQIQRTVHLEVIDFDTSFNFVLEIQNCEDSLVVVPVMDSAYDFSNVHILWEMNWSDSVWYSDQLVPRIVTKQSGALTMTGTVFDDFGCSISKTNTIQLEPVTDFIIEKIIACQGETIELNPDFNENYQYEWFPESEFDSPNQPNPVLNALEDDTVSVRIYNSYRSCYVEKNIIIIVEPTIQQADFDIQVDNCVDSLVLKIASIQTEPAELVEQITWNLADDNQIQQDTGHQPSFLIPESQMVTLSMNLNESGNCPFSIKKSFQLNLLEGLADTSSLSICQGESVHLLNQPLPEDYRVQWSPAGGLDDVQSNNPIATPNRTTLYQVDYTDSTGLCQLSSTVKVIVLDTLEQFSVRHEMNCNGRTVTFFPTPLINLQWDFGDNTSKINTEKVDSVIHPYSEGGDYLVKVYAVDASFCPDTLTVPIQLPAQSFKANATWAVDSCINNIATLELSNLSESSLYPVTRQHWSLSNGLQSNEANPVFQISENDSIDVLLTITVNDDSRCQDSTTLKVPPLLVAVPALKDTIIGCTGTQIALNPSFNPAYQYRWNPAVFFENSTLPNPVMTIGNGSGDDYQVTVSNEYGCRATNNIHLKGSKLSIDTKDNHIVCQPEEVLLKATAPDAQQQWWLSATGDTLSKNEQFSYFVNQNEVLKAVFEDQYGCIFEKNVNLWHNAIEAAFDSTIRVCEATPVTLEVAINNSDNLTNMEWTPIAPIIEGANSLHPTVLPDESTTFEFTATNVSGCSFTGKINVSVEQAPDITITTSNDTIYEGESIQLEATFDPDFSYEWMPTSFLDAPNSHNPLATPDAPIAYRVEVTTGAGCVSTADVSLFIQSYLCENSNIFIPSAFTPNGDGVNDILYVRGGPFAVMEFVIFDRWGDRVFYTNNQDLGWNGTKNGKDLPPGVFGYFLRATCGNGELIERQGNITLIR